MMKNWLLATMAFSFIFFSCKSNSDDTAEKEAPVEEVAPANKLNYQMEWTAFKTPAKAPVKGTFTSISYDNVNDEGATLEDKVNGATFKIDATSLESGDEGRNHNIVSGLFEKMTGTEISGSFSKFENGKTDVSITMNDVTKSIPFEYSQNGDTLVITGTIDIVKDFAANKAMANFAELCGELHEGKSWTDVDITTKIYQ